MRIMVIIFAIVAVNTLLPALTVNAQIKIGNITLPDSIVKAYLLDCYQHPDTIAKRNSQDFGCCINCSMPAEDFRDCDTRAREFNIKLRENSISGEIIKTVYYKAYYDTVYEHSNLLMFPSGMSAKENDSYNKKQRGKVVSINFNPAGSYQINTGKFLIPRKPSESDFIKWFNKSNP